jgi:N-acetylmuramoyl-L-alanine amidase
MPIIFLFLLCSFAFSQDTIADLRIEKGYVDGVDFGKKLKMQMSWQSEAGILKIGASSWVLGNAWASLKDTSFLLQAPVQDRINGKRAFWLPLPSSLQVFEKMLNKPLKYDSASARIFAGFKIDSVKVDSVKIDSVKKDSAAVELKDIWSVNFDVKENGEILEIKLSKAFVAEQFYAHPNYILRINGAQMDSALFQDMAKKSSMISRAIPIQEAQSAQLTLTLKDNIESAELLKKDGGKTLQLVMRKKQAAKKAEPPPPASSSKKIKTIIIDPGHGGKDPGAIGPKNLQEKDVVLAVGLKLKKNLEDKGFTVKMTRGKDEYLDLSARPKMASDWGGDLFISLHCNAIRKELQSTTDGFKFYILRAGGSEEDKAIARRENQAIMLETGKKGKTEISPAEWIVLDNQLALYAERSALLAGPLVESFDGGTVRKQGTGAGQAGFMVLAGAYMPAVLAELGYITHPKDSEFLGSEKGQNELAERLAKAIANFAK